MGAHEIAHDVRLAAPEISTGHQHFCAEQKFSRPPLHFDAQHLYEETMNQEQSIEQQIVNKGLTAPRVTLAELNDNIVHTEIVKHVTPSGQVLRWGVLTVKSGFGVTGRPSVAVSSANDDAEIGERTAIDNARSELWPLMGYALREKLAAG